nr:tripartite tricarboxylate transporter permease [Candidatus Symbiopectobacterium sp. 'North America']
MPVPHWRLPRWGRFFAGTLATFVIGFFSPSLASMAIRFGPADYFSLLVLGLIGAVVLAQGSLLKAITMVVVGLLLGLVGTDINSGELHFTFGIPELADGIDFVPLAMGVFGIGEIIRVLVQQEKSGGTVIEHGKLMPSAQNIRQSSPAVLRGSLLGSVLGLLPGGRAALASFAAYTVEKSWQKTHPGLAKGLSKGLPRRNPPITQRRKPRLFRCSRWDYRQTPLWP